MRCTGAARITDAKGRWTLNNVPEGEYVEVRVRLSHPDYISDYHWGVMQNAAGVTMASFRDQTGTIAGARSWVLGDIINGVDPHGCLDRLHTWAGRQGVELVAIKGNAEEYTLTPDLDQFPLAKESFYPSLLLLLKWIRARLSSADLIWLHSLPEVIVWVDNLIVHDSPVDRLTQVVPPGVDPRYEALLRYSSVPYQNID